MTREPGSSATFEDSHTKEINPVEMPGLENL